MRDAIPPAPRHIRVRGVAVRPENLPGPHFPFQASTIVATALRCARFQAAANLNPYKTKGGAGLWATERGRKGDPTIPVQAYGCFRSSRVGMLRVFST